MTTETMTVHQALSELKMLDKRIGSAVSRSTFCVANKHSNTKIGGKKIEDACNVMREDCQSIEDLLKRRAAIRNNLSISNASTKITVAGIEYSIAEAIEMKGAGIGIKRMLLDKMIRDYNSAMATINKANSKLTDDADNYVVGLFGSKEKNASSDNVRAVREAYIQENTVDLVDPLDVSKKIKDLEAEIETFESEVDSKISVSNALTTITVEY